MKRLSRSRKVFYRLLHIKPSPLRQGKNGPYIFIHINKTAGTSIGRAIGLPVKDHLTAKEIIAKIGEDKWQEAYKFTLVRNPWDKVVSLYEYRRKKDKNRIATQNVSFADWVKMTHGSGRDTRYYDNPKSFQPQVEWLKDTNGSVSIDFVGQFESINESFNHVKTVIGLDAELPHLNASRRAGYRSYYDDETRELVERWYSEDIERFGYAF
ncbi:MAG: sulfotransferase family 2 domain-containing protein [Xanthomonadales bacterium]|nr:sulfotransferase family protein [Gammaproteobacteria bacterium]NNK05237.1 sulfotransferase family 2 domain-containing protein [Xanthomonadales bacterium]